MSSYDIRYQLGAGAFDFSSATPVTEDMLALGSDLDPAPGGQIKAVAVQAILFRSREHFENKNG